MSIILRECRGIREKTQPDAWTTFNTQSLLGAALLGQKKYADAEPLLLAGYEGMTQREKTIPPPAATRLPEALDRLIGFYTATNKPDQVKKWQADRAKYPLKDGGKTQTSNGANVSSLTLSAARQPKRPNTAPHQAAAAVGSSSFTVQ